MAYNPYASSSNDKVDYSVFDLSKKDIKLYRPSVDGAVAFDLLPYKITSKHNNAILHGASIGDESVFAEIHIHSNVGPLRRKVVCPKKTWNGKCPICEEQEKQAKELGWKHADVKALFPKTRLVFNLRDTEGVFYLLDVAEFKGVNPSFLAMVQAAGDKIKLRKKLENVYWADYQTGYTIEASIKMDQMKDKDGKPSGEKFPTYFNISLLEREEPYTKAIFDTTFDPMSIVKTMTYDEIEKIFYAVDDTTEEDEDDDDGETAHGMNTDPDPAPEPAKDEIKEERKTLGVKPKDDEPTCPEGLRYAKDFNKDEVCKNCSSYLDCRRANKALAQ